MLQLRRGESIQDEIGRALLSGRTSHSDTKTDKVAGAQMLHQGANPIVTPGPTPLCQAARTKGQVEVIMEGHNTLRGELKKTGDTPHRQTAAIHVGEGFDQDDRFGKKLAARKLGIPFSFTLKGDTVNPNQVDDEHKTYVMSGRLVLTTGVAKPYKHAHNHIPKKQDPHACPFTGSESGPGK